MGTVLSPAAFHLAPAAAAAPPKDDDGGSKADGTTRKVESVSEEIAAAKEAAIAKLSDVIVDADVPSAANAPGSRAGSAGTAMAPRDALLHLLRQNVTGRTGKNIDAMRLAITGNYGWQQYRRAKGITGTDFERGIDGPTLGDYAAWMRTDSACSDGVMASRLEGLEGLRLLGFDVAEAGPAANHAAGKKPVRSPDDDGNARVEYSPYDMYRLGFSLAPGAKTGAGVAVGAVTDDYMLHKLFQVTGSARPGDYAASVLRAYDPAAKVLHFRCDLDKTGRQWVDHYVPADTFVGEAPANIDAFVARHVGRKYLYEDFQYVSGGSYKVDESVGFTDPPTKKPTATADKAVLRALECATGRSNEERKADKTSGAHGQRKVLPEVAARLAWDDAMIDVLGDWAPAPKKESGAPSGRVMRSAKKPKSLRRRTTQDKYTPRASKPQQIRARRLAIEAARVAIRLGGGGAIARDKTWHDIIPETKPAAGSELAELAPYYVLTLAG